MIGADTELEECGTAMLEALATIGLRCNRGKSLAWNAPTAATSLQFTETTGGICALGVAFGDEKFQADTCMETAKEQSFLLPRLVSLRKHAAFTLLRYEAPSKMVFLLRTHPPEVACLIVW